MTAVPSIPRTSRALIAYFDTNIYDQIYKRETPPEVLIGLGTALGRGALKVLLSETLLEELAAVVGTDPSGAAGRVRLAGMITCWREVGLIRDHSELLRDSVLALENGAEPPSKFKSADLVPKFLAAMASPNPALTEKFLVELQRRKTEFKDGNRRAATELRGGFETLLTTSPPSFDEFWRWMIAQKLSVVLGQLGDRLTISSAADCPALLTAAGVAASLMYAETVEGRAAQSGDSRDMHQAVVATAAGVFVTHDREFARRLLRIPGLAFRVASLAELVASLDLSPTPTAQETT